MRCGTTLAAQYQSARRGGATFARPAPPGQAERTGGLRLSGTHTERIKLSPALQVSRNFRNGSFSPLLWGHSTHPLNNLSIRNARMSRKRIALHIRRMTIFIVLAGF